MLIQLARFYGTIRQFVVQFFAPPPEDIREAFYRMQYQRLSEQIPYLHLIVIIFCCLVIITDLAHKVSWNIAWLVAIIILCLIRMARWKYFQKEPEDLVDVKAAIRKEKLQFLFNTTIVGLILAAFYYINETPTNLVVPALTCFGALSASHIMSPMRKSACCALLLGMRPMVCVMLLSGSLEVIDVAIATILITVIQFRYIEDKYQQNIRNVRLDQEILYHANFDSLTNVINRRYFKDEVNKCIANNKAFALCIIDMDDFKKINDLKGHFTGDLYLIKTATRLKLSIKPTDMVSRMGGDEFAILLHGITCEFTARQRAEDILKNLCRPAHFEDTIINIMASMGYALFPENGKDFDAIYCAADQALYLAKSRGKCCAAGAEETMVERNIGIA